MQDTAPPLTARSRDSQTLMLDERIQLIARRSFVAALSTPVAALLLLFIAHAEQLAQTMPFGIWFTLVLSSVAISLSLTTPVFIYKRPPSRPQLWLHGYMGSKFLLGITWGSAVWFLLQQPTPVMSLMVYVVLCGIGAVVVIMQSIFWRSAMSFLLGLLLPVLLKALAPQSVLEIYIAIAGVLYVGLLALYSAVINRQLTEGVRAGIDARLLTEDLLQANLRAEQALSALQTEHGQLQQALRTIRQMAEQDELTRLMNRRAMLDQLHASHARLHSGRTATTTLALFDIDLFKQINDQHGHDVGDRVLLALAIRLGDALHSGEQLARFGGEEFIILFDGLDSAAAAQRIATLQAVLDAAPLLPAPLDFPVTASFGIATLSLQQSVDQWLKHADEAMYDAKRNGRNQLQIKR